MSYVIQTVSQWSIVAAEVVASLSGEPDPVPFRKTPDELQDMMTRQLDQLFDTNLSVPLSTLLRRQIGRTVQILLYSTGTDTTPAQDLRAEPLHDDPDTTQLIWQQDMAKKAIGEASRRMAQEISTHLNANGLEDLHIRQSRYLETSSGEHIDIGWAELGERPWIAVLSGHGNRECQVGFKIGVKPLPLTH